MKWTCSALCAAAALLTLSPAAFAARQKPIPAVNESGSAIFDQLRNEAIEKKIPLVIYMTGSSWCVYCNIFTKNHIRKDAFQRAIGSKFMFWLVDSKQIPGKHPNSFKFQFIPEEAAKVVGCLDSDAPYMTFGPPSVFILDPVSGKIIRKLVAEESVTKEGKPLEEIIERCWKEFGAKKQ